MILKAGNLLALLFILHYLSVARTDIFSAFRANELSLLLNAKKGEIGAFSFTFDPFLYGRLLNVHITRRRACDGKAWLLRWEDRSSITLHG